MRSPHLLAAAGVSVAVAAAAAASAVGAVVGAVAAAAVVVVVLLPCLGNVIHLVECCEHKSTRARRVRRLAISATAASEVCARVCAATGWGRRHVVSWAAWRSGDTEQLLPGSGRCQGMQEWGRGRPGRRRRCLKRAPMRASSGGWAPGSRVAGEADTAAGRERRAFLSVHTFKTRSIKIFTRS